MSEGGTPIPDPDPAGEYPDGWHEPSPGNITLQSDVALTAMDADTVTFGGGLEIIKITLAKGVWHNLNDPQVLGFTFEGDPEWAVNGNYPVPA